MVRFFCCLVVSFCFSAVADTVLQDFERGLDVNVWEVTEGGALVWEAGALRVPMGVSMHTSLLRRDWRGHEGFAFDVVNVFDSPISVKVVLSDDGWLDRRSFWNQHHRFLLAAPGRSTLVVPFSSLYRGTEAQRSMDLKSPFNVGAVMRVGFEFRGQRGEAVLDNLRLVGGLGVGVSSGSLRGQTTSMGGTRLSGSISSDGRKVLNGFERLGDVVRWEKREGWFEPVQCEEHVSEGLHSFKVAPGSLLVNMSPTRDWSGFEVLELDAFVEGKEAMTLEVMVGDDAWAADQHYYNRHNSVHGLVPGENVVRISLGALYRGEAQKRNTRIGRNVDLDAIAQVNFRVRGKGGFVFFDGLRLVGKGAGSLGVQEGSMSGSGLSEAARSDGVLMLCDFEGVGEVLGWEMREGWFEPVVVAEHVRFGKGALKVASASLLANVSLSRDWSGFGFLALDVFVEAKGAMSLEVMVGDAAWGRDGGYYNRHNSVHGLVPGENRVRISLAELYRGEARKRNVGIGRNVDLDAIEQVNFRVRGEKGGFVFFDGLRLVGGRRVGGSLAGSVGLGSLRGQTALVGTLRGSDRVSSAVRVVKKKVGRRGDLVWGSFESLRDVALWEARRGEVGVSGEHATFGVQSGLTYPGALLACVDVPRDWRGYESLAFDVFYEGEGLVKVEVMLGDEAWRRKQTYWNRYNRVFSLVPGENTIRIPVEGLFRGEAASRGRDLKGNLDVGRMVQMNLWFKGGEGGLFLDGCRLEGFEEGFRAPEVGGEKLSMRRKGRVFGFDFGPEDQALWPGFEAVSWNTVYGVAGGFGFERAQPRARNASDVTFPTSLLQDAVHVERGDFRVDVSNGVYVVYVFFEDAGYWGGEYAKFGVRSISAEGRERVVEDRRERGGDADALWLFEDVEPLSEGMPVLPYLERLYGPRRFEVEVVDGQLNVFPWSDAQWGTRVSALVVHGAGDVAAEGWVDVLWERNLEALRSRAAWVRPRVEGMPVLDGGLGLFVPSLDDEVLLTDRPGLVEGVPVLEGVGCAGETLTFVFGLLAEEDVEGLSFGLRGFRSVDGAGGVVWEQGVSQVRHLAKRGYEDLSYRVVPWYVHPARNYPVLKGGEAREFVLEVEVADGALPGVYEEEVLVRGAGGVLRRLLLRAEVLDFVLPRPDFPISFFGMGVEDFGLFARMGATGVSGGGGFRISSWRDGEPVLDFSGVDGLFGRAREAGLMACALGYGGPVVLAGMHPEWVEDFFEKQGKAAGLSAGEAAGRVYAAVAKHAAAAGWPDFRINLVDEPQSLEQVGRLEASARFLREAVPEIPTVGYLAYTSLDVGSKYHGLYEALQGVVTKGYDRALVEGEREVYLYSLGRRRYVFGPLLWAHRRNGVAGYIQWHAGLFYGYQFFDLDGREPDMGLVMRRSDGVFPTLDLLRIREGIYDLRYVLLLEERVATAPECAAAKEAAIWLAGWRGRIDTGRRSPPVGYRAEVFRAECLRLLRGF